MLESVMSILFDAINAVFSWFEVILQETDTYYLVLGVIVLLIFWRLVIAPLFGGASFRSSSDSVRPTKTLTTTLSPFTTADGQTWYQERETMSISTKV